MSTGKQLLYGDVALQRKNDIIAKYPGIHSYLEKVEVSITENPVSSVKEKILLSNGTTKICYKKQCRTDLFSGLIPDPYLYLSISYTISEKHILIIGVYLHNYTS
jgi:hypothetical protein